ncbi:hypothetical protein quinque_005056 [Culex quinquefasciatus]
MKSLTSTSGKGFFGKISSLFNALLTGIFKKLYLLISTVLFLDTWLLQTSASDVTQGRRKRKFLLWLLILLPFLLFGGLYLYLDPAPIESLREMLPTVGNPLQQLDLNFELPSVEPVRAFAAEKWHGARDFAGFYLDSLKVLSENAFAEVQKIWQENVNAFLLADEDQTIVLPASKRATIALSSLGAVLPASLNPSDLDAFRANLFQKLDWRESSLSWSALLPSLDLWSFWDRSPRGGGGQQQYENLKSGLQRSLSAEEYDELMRHIDAYIEGLLAEKYRKKEEEAAAQKVKREIEPEVVVHVAGVVQQSLKAYSYELTQGDVDRVAEQVRVTLVKSYPEVFDPTVKGEKREAVGISEANFVEIQRLIKQQISVTNNNFVISDQQLEELLMKILSSAKLMDLIDSRILLKTKDLRGQQESQSALVENLKNEINEIKQHFTEKLAASSLMLEDNINVLKRSQDKLAEQVSGFRIENDEKYIKLLADIDARLAAVQREQFSGLNSIIKKNIVTILGMNVEQDFTDEDLKTWISNLFVAKDYLENRLKEYQAGVNAVIQQEMERSAATLMKEVSDRIQQEVLVSIQSHKADLNTATDTPPSASGLTEDTVRRIVRDALRIYDADKTGLVDYALESAGGQILSTRCTENYQTHSAQISIFGIPLWYPTNTPRTVISPTMQPGQCWAFSGFPGYLATSTIVSGLCALNVITIPVKTEAETTDAFGVYYVEKYIPLEQTRPVVRQNPEHLFNLLYDPREPGCTQLTVERSSVGTPDKFTFSLSPDCYQKPFGSVVSLDYAGMSQDGARTMRYKCRNGTLQLAHHFSDFILVQLRVSFLFAEELLLMEDLSARAPPGSWMMLRRDTGNGTKKCAFIQLNSAVVVTGFSLEHISKLLAPNNQIDSAPKNFSVWGLATEHDPDPVQLGSYVYQDNSAALQYFPVDEPTRPELAGRAFRIVELRIESNHGNAHYTCLYRFRVHGERV